MCSLGCAGPGARGVGDGGVGRALLSGAVAFSGGGLSFLALGLQLVLNGLYETCFGSMEVSRNALMLCTEKHRFLEMHSTVSETSLGTDSIEQSRMKSQEVFYFLDLPFRYLLIRRSKLYRIP